MWVSPNHPDPPRSTPPEDDGIRLLTLPRPDDCELRVSLATYHGHAYVRLQLWRRGRWGNRDWWPVRGRVLSLRTGEIARLIAALHQVESLLEREPQGTHQEPRQQRPAPPPGHRMAPRPDRPTGAVGDMTAGADDHPRFIERRRRPGPRPLDPGKLSESRGSDPDFDELS